MKVTITGPTGFLGRRLIKSLLAKGASLRALSRRAVPGVESHTWDTLSGPPPEAALAGADVVIHLAGEPVGQRWSEEVKKKIRESRVRGTTALVQALSVLPRRPEALICASATGFYGDRGDEVLTEASRAGQGFLPEVCREWEEAAHLAESLGIRVVQVRTGIVLGPDGGALEKMLPPFRFGIGGRLGSGRQWMSWIHADDIIELYVRAAEDSGIRGALNGVAPTPVRNDEFTRQLGSALHRPAVIPVPGFGLRLLFGEMAGVMLESQRVLPEAARSAGYVFRYPELGSALRQILG